MKKMASTKTTVIVSSAIIIISITAVVILKLSLPVILDILTLTYQLPLLWSTHVLTFLQPPYLYLLINCIILSIVASSKLHPPRVTPYHHHHDLPSPLPENFTLNFPTTSISTAEERGGGDDTKEVEVVFGCVEETPVKVATTVDNDDEEEFLVSMRTPPNKRLVAECSPPVSARFGHRRGVKASPQGKSLLKVSRPKKQETLESTWRNITEGRPMPLTRHLKKSETFTNASQHAPPKRVVKKSETFSGIGNSSPASNPGGKMRREPSLSQDELNRRVEAFIKKFNDEMRLQRQESLNHYRQMVGGGAH